MTRSLFAALITTTALAWPALADTIEGTAAVRHVTLYPDGATVVRRVTIDAPAGSHDLVLPGLPQGTNPDALRVQATGARLGAVSLQQARALPQVTPDTAAIAAARAELRRLESALRARDAATAAIRAEAQAAEDVIAFLRDLAKAEGAAAGDVATLSQTVEARILQARRRAIAAEAAARDSEIGREDDVKLIEAARARLSALENPAMTASAEALVIAIDSAGGPAEIEITANVDAAGWRPVYDLRMDRDAGEIAVERGAVIHQATGEDWDDVTLTLSTARPGDQSAPTEVPPEHIHIRDPSEDLRRLSTARGGAMTESMNDAAMAPAPVEEAMQAQLGLTVVYEYPSAVTVRDGVDALRLALGAQTLTPTIRAEAAPRFDSTAYLVAEGTNTLGAPILPGPATVYADGAMVGQTHLPLIAEGDDILWGFGRIDGLTAERRVPDRLAGGRGLIRRASAEAQTAQLIIRNLTDESWPLRVTDSVPISEQEDLTVTWSATPEPTAQDPDGRRGVLEWDSEIAPGAEQVIEVVTNLRWPEGMQILR